MVFVNDVRARQFVSRAVCVLILAAGLAPGRLQASCGHDVTSKSSRSAQATRADLQFLGVTAVQTVDIDPHRPIPARTCSGVYCPRTPRSPLAAQSTFEQRIELWCGISDVSARGTLVSAAQFAFSSKLHPRHGTLPPQRPPRRPLLGPIL